VHARLIILVGVVGLALPSSAAALHSVRPPGFSSLSQYTEVVPTASGAAPTTAPAPAPGTRATSSAPAAALDRVVAATAPAKVAVRGQPLGAGESAVGSVALSLRGGGGMGLALPAILVAGVLVVLALLARRRRARS
jgi:hypothetical protein